MARKPDVFQKKAASIRLDHIASPWTKQIPMEAWPAIEYRIAQALRRYHARVRRLVQYEESCRFPAVGWTLRDCISRSSLSSKLDRLKKGTQR